MPSTIPIKSKNPKIGEYFGNNFPEISIKDMVALQKKLIDHIDIKKNLSN